MNRTASWTMASQASALGSSSEASPGDARRLSWIDYAKGIAICLVVVGHVNRGLISAGLANAESDSVLTRVNLYIYAFHMPVFFFVGGMFCRRLRSRPAAQGFASIVSSVVYPYFFWATIQTLLMLAVGKYTNSKVTIDNLWTIFESPPMQFWFLYVYGILALSYLALSKIGSSRVGIAIAFVMLWILGAYDVLPWARVLNWIQFYGLFFVVGDLTGDLAIKFFSRRPSRLPVAVLAILAFLLLGAIFYFPGSPAWGVSAACAFLGIAGTLSVGYVLASGGLISILRSCGIYSLEIYVLHTIVSAAVRIGLVHVCGVRSLPIHLTVGILAGIVVPLVIAANARQHSYEWLFRLPITGRKKHEASGGSANAAGGSA
jgi:fucose 4-O-acetylase-like acetyltransferase